MTPLPNNSQETNPMNTRAAIDKAIIKIFTTIEDYGTNTEAREEILAFITEANAALIERVETEVIGRDATGDHEIAEGVRQFQAEQRQKLRTLKQQVGGKS